MSTEDRASYIIVDPATRRGKYQICRRQIGGRYVCVAEARSQTFALEVLAAFEKVEHTEDKLARLRVVMGDTQAAE
jgi:hypothetical protein